MPEHPIRHPYVAAWCRMLDNLLDEAEELRRAAEADAPADAVYETTDKRWRLFSELPPVFQQRLVQHLPVEATINPKQ